MREDDTQYIRHLEDARNSGEKEIKWLEDELMKCHKLIGELQEELNPTHMGEPLVNKDVYRYRWITRANRERELRIPATEDKKSIDAAIDKAMAHEKLRLRVSYGRPTRIV